MLTRRRAPDTKFLSFLLSCSSLSSVFSFFLFSSSKSSTPVPPPTRHLEASSKAQPIHAQPINTPMPLHHPQLEIPLLAPRRPSPHIPLFLRQHISKAIRRAIASSSCSAFIHLVHSTNPSPSILSNRPRVMRSRTSRWRSSSILRREWQCPGRMRCPRAERREGGGGGAGRFGGYCACCGGRVCECRGRGCAGVAGCV